MYEILAKMYNKKELYTPLFYSLKSVRPCGHKLDDLPRVHQIPKLVNQPWNTVKIRNLSCKTYVYILDGGKFGIGSLENDINAIEKLYVVHHFKPLQIIHTSILIFSLHFLKADRNVMNRLVETSFIFQKRYGKPH